VSTAVGIIKYRAPQPKLERERGKEKERRERKRGERERGEREREERDIKESSWEK